MKRFLEMSLYILLGIGGTFSVIGNIDGVWDLYDKVEILEAANCVQHIQ